MRLVLRPYELPHSQIPLKEQQGKESIEPHSRGREEDQRQKENRQRGWKKRLEGDRSIPHQREQAEQQIESCQGNRKSPYAHDAAHAPR